MKKEVNLCDFCEKKVSEYRCDICKADMCKEHSGAVVNVTVSSNVFGEIMFCPNCKKRYASIKRKQGSKLEDPGSFYDLDFQKEIYSKVLQYVKSKIIAEEL